MLPAVLAVEAAGEIAYTTPPVRGGTTPFGVGLGVRAGVVFERLYLGVSGTGYLGGSDIDISDRSIVGGVEAGYGFFLVPSGGRLRLVLRPLVGVGGAVIYHVDPSLTRAASPDVVTSASTRGASSDTTSLENVYVKPALELILGWGSFFGGVMGNVLVLPGVSYSGDTTTWVSYGFGGQLGYRF